MTRESISPLVAIALEQFTPEQQTKLNQWYDQLDEEWLTAIADSESKQSHELAEMEANWKAEQEYYHDRFLYDDRL
jgi:hypothetical protein